MAWWLRTLAALPKDLGLNPRSHMVAITPAPGGSEDLFWRLPAAGMHVVYKHTYSQNIHIYKTIITVIKTKQPLIQQLGGRGQPGL